MSRPGAHVSTILAMAATGASICAASWAINAPGAANRSVLINLFEAIAVIWATKYAAENLRQLREVEESRLNARLIVALHQSSAGTEQIWDVEIHNYGASIAVGVRVESRFLGGTAESRTHWEKLPFQQSYVRPNDHIEAPLLLPIWLLANVHAFEVRVTYSGAAEINRQTTWRFAVDVASLASVGRIVDSG